MKKVNGVRRCRLCACEENFSEFIDIFDDNPEMELEMKITKLLPIVVMRWDPMPHIICRMCINQLNSFNEFYEGSLKAERFLRTLHPSAPMKKIEKGNANVKMGEAPISNNNSLTPPPKKVEKVCLSPNKSSKDPLNASELIVESSLGDEIQQNSKKTLNSFIINHITSTDSVYTCRKCFRTFTRSASALSHPCIRLEDCDELEKLRGEEEEEINVTTKSLPPLKIRLFSVTSGLYVCYLCQSRFNKKTDVVEHIKEHFVDGQWGAATVKKSRQGGRKKGRHKEPETDDKREETYKIVASSRKRKSPWETPRRRRRSRTKSKCASTEPLKICAKNGQSENSSEELSPVKVKVERAAQCLNFSEVENDTRAKNEGTDLPENANKNRPAAVPISPVKTGESRLETQAEPKNARVSSVFEDLVSFGNDRDLMEVVPLSKNETANLKKIERSPKADEVTIVEVIDHKSPLNFSACIFCDKIFSSKNALSSHQNRHLQWYTEFKPGRKEVKTALAPKENYTCNVCAMMFTSQKTLMEHEQYHVVDVEEVGKQRKVRALNQGPKRKVETKKEVPKGRSFLEITVSSGEKEIPQIDLI